MEYDITESHHLFKVEALSEHFTDGGILALFLVEIGIASTTRHPRRLSESWFGYELVGKVSFKPAVSC
eukprot:1238782-Amphidinium_carterae.1